MKRTIVFLLLVSAGIFAASAATVPEQKWKVQADNFDGAKFMKRYSLSREDFGAERDANGDMWVFTREGIALPDDPPIFEAPDTTKRDRLSVLRAKMRRSEDLNMPQLNEYLRLTAGI